MVQRDRVDIVTGIVFSNILLALSDTVLKDRRGVFLINSNAGPSQLAGKDCNPNFFVGVVAERQRCTRRWAST